MESKTRLIRRIRIGAGLLCLLASPFSLSAREGLTPNDACASDGTCCKGEDNEICVHDNDPPLPNHYWQGVAGKCGSVKDGET